MKSCAFFGHRKGDYEKEEKVLFAVIAELIERYQVVQFYAGGRGVFDWLGARLVADLRVKNPQIKLTQVLSYIPKEKEGTKPLYFDDTVYLLERKVPPRFSILETNKLLVEKVDFVVSGVKYCGGGARTAVEYAQKRKKTVIDVCKGKEDFFIKQILERENARL
ncbi:MAG: hypothetical protein IJ373_02605 [Clostridia bacterium]|nr:hypothetical protein [Clostridia bacterium]